VWFINSFSFELDDAIYSIAGLCLGSFTIGNTSEHFNAADARLHKNEECEQDGALVRAARDRRIFPVRKPASA
jgi:hypothetical protein